MAINHVVLMMQENRTFDTYFGMLNPYRAANGFKTCADGVNFCVDGIEDKLATFKIGPVQAAERVPLDSPVGRWAAAALAASPPAGAPSVEPVRVRMMGGTVPTDVLVDALRLPFVLVPTVNPDNNQHSHDENLRIGNFVSGTRTIRSLLTMPYGA